MKEQSNSHDQQCDCPNCRGILRAQLLAQNPDILSPRPETFTIRISVFFIVGARLIAPQRLHARFRAGIMPSVRARTVVAFNASMSEAGTYWARPES